MILPTILRSSSAASSKQIIAFRSTRYLATLATSSTSFNETSFAFNPAHVQLGTRQQRPLADNSAELKQLLQQNETVYNDLAYGLSFATEDSNLQEKLSKLSPTMLLQLEQIATSRNQLRRNNTAAAVLTPLDDAPLPMTLEDAFRNSKRAIVITEAVKPFRIVDVNDAWTQLCGYSYVEAKEQTLGSLLKGPDTNELAATGLISQLLQGEQAGTTLVNYTKDKRSFRNRIRVRPLNDGKHFVGVLQEVAM